MKKGFWNTQYSDVLTAPMERKTLIETLLERTGNTRAVVQAAISYNLNKGKLVVIDDKICLPEWTDPAKVAT